MYMDLQEKLRDVKQQEKENDSLMQIQQIKELVKERKINYQYFKPFAPSCLLEMGSQVSEIVTNMMTTGDSDTNISISEQDSVNASGYDLVINSQENANGLQRQQSVQQVNSFKQSNRNNSVSSLTHQVTIDLSKEMQQAYIDTDGQIAIRNGKVRETMERLEHLQPESIPSDTQLVILQSQYEQEGTYIYNGQIDKHKGTKEGQGTMVNTSTGSIYTGQFSNGVPKGYGRIISKEGDYFQGYTNNLQPEGKGECGIRGDNQVVEGDFSQGVRQGWFIERTPQMTVNVFYHKGVISDNEDITVVYADRGEYFGEHKGYVLEGKGRMDYANGDKYQGVFKSGRMEGQGVYLFKDGSIYEGSFVNDCPHGEAIYYYSDGLIYKGSFQNGLQHGKALEMHKHNNTSRIGEWKHGTFQRWIS